MNKASTKPYFDYNDIVYDKLNNEALHNNIEIKSQNDAVLSITGAIVWTFWKKLYAELGLEHLIFRLWF